MTKKGAKLRGAVFFSLIVAVQAAVADTKVGTLDFFTSKNSKRVIFVKNDIQAELRQATRGLSATERAKLKRAMRRPVLLGDEVTVTDGFLDTNKAFVGIKDVGAELFPKRPVKDSLGMTHVYYQQLYNGVPVLGGEVSVHLAKDGGVAAAGFQFAEGISLSVVPRIPQTKAQEIASSTFTREFDLLGKPLLYHSALRVMHDGLMENSPKATARLVWEIKLRAVDLFATPAPDETYYIDAQSGEVIKRITNVQYQGGGVPLYRRVYDCTPTVYGTAYAGCFSNTSWPEIENGYPWGRIETAPERAANPRYGGYDVNTLFTLLGGFDSYLWETFGLDGPNGKGGMSVVVGVQATTGNVYQDASWGAACPNASFGNNNVGFCQGTVVPDTVGHELTHGMMHWRSGGAIWTYGETGAINEATADVMGEAFERYSTGTNNWISGLEIKYPRSLEDPPSLPASANWPHSPDQFFSPYFYCGQDDNQGIHYNSTAVSKAFYLIAEGGDFNGCSIRGSGMDVAQKIMYRAMMHYYSYFEDFNDAYMHYTQACQDLYPSGDTCSQVVAALQAVELDQMTPCGGFEVTPLCRKPLLAFGTIYEKPDTQNIPLAGATVSILDLTRTTVLASTTTDSQGKFKLRGDVPDGTYIIRTSKDSYATYSGATTIRKSVSLPFSVTLYPPVMASVPAEVEVNEGETVSLALSATDQNKDKLTFAGEGLPEGATLVNNTNNTAEFAWVPAREQAGAVHELDLTVSDGYFRRGQSVKITVLKTNSAPEIRAPESLVESEGKRLQFSVTVSDPDPQDAARVSVVNLPEGAAFNEATGIFSWTPGFNQSGTHEITFTATDLEGASASAIVRITVSNSSLNGAARERHSRASLAGVSVHVLNMRTGAVYNATTDANGLYVLAQDLPAGHYMLVATKAFHAPNVSVVRIGAGQSLRADFVLTRLGGWWRR